MRWRDRAACVGLEDLFFPDEQPGDQRGRINQARQICGQCPVNPECLQEALTISPYEDYGGIWAGTTATQRIWLRRTNPDTAFHTGKCGNCGSHYTRIRTSGPTPKYCSTQCQRRAKRKAS